MNHIWGSALQRTSRSIISWDYGTVDKCGDVTMYKYFNCVVYNGCISSIHTVESFKFVGAK